MTKSSENGDTVQVKQPPTISLTIEVPEAIAKAFEDYIKSQPHLDQNQVGTSALSYYLLTHGVSSREVNQAYLSSTFVC